MMKSILSRVSTRSIVILMLVGGAIALAAIDPNFRAAYGDLAKVGIGGYLGQLLPNQRDREN